jgi:hypothetical protein
MIPARVVRKLPNQRPPHCQRLVGSSFAALFLFGSLEKGKEAIILFGSHATGDARPRLGGRSSVA